MSGVDHIEVRRLLLSLVEDQVAQTLIITVRYQTWMLMCVHTTLQPAP